MKRLVASIACLAAVSAQAQAANGGCGDTAPGFGVHVDNDALSWSKKDSDYTGGFAVQLTPRDQSARPLPHLVHDTFDRLLHVPRAECRRYAWQFGLLALTPGTLRSLAPVPGDRPFASLLLFGTTAMWDGANERTAWQTQLEIGALGLELAESLHDVAHELVDDERPQGYQYQISEGGEPTFRYVIARHRLRKDAIVRGETMQTKSTLALSAGYLTEASMGWSLRWGRIDSPWQNFAPELADYLPAAMPAVPSLGERELFGFVGARVKLRAYNALTQGQVRDTVYRLHADELENWLGELWAGVHWQPAAGWSITYTVRAQTPDLRPEPGRRTQVWAGLSFARRF
jgi:hypothetical protein